MKGLPLLQETVKSEKKRFEEETQKHFEAFWDAFADLKSAREKIRVERTLELLEKEKLGAIIDLGCGRAPFLSFLSEKGAKVTLLDVAQNSLKISHLGFVRGCLPYLKFPDESFDGLLMTEVIAEIEPHLHRLTLSEVARLLKKGGWALFSTSIDIHSEDALSSFLALLQTEFEIIEKKISYDRLYFYLERFLKAPSRFAKAKESSYRRRQLEKRRGFFRLWFYLNSTPALILVWQPLSKMIEPFKNFILQSPRTLLFFEKISKILLYDSSMTHVIVRARKKRLF